MVKTRSNRECTDEVLFSFRLQQPLFDGEKQKDVAAASQMRQADKGDLRRRRAGDAQCSPG